MGDCGCNSPHRDPGDIPPVAPPLSLGTVGASVSDNSPGQPRALGIFIVLSLSVLLLARYGKG